MDTARSITKSGWHPKGKDGGKESWRGDYKGINQVVCAPVALDSVSNHMLLTPNILTPS